jgi:ABC-type multidrug transport system ATPase subunit
MIDVVNVTQHYGVRPVLREINLRIERGQVIAILGPNGMGKTTLLSVIAGVLSPQTGYVEIEGFRRRRSLDEELEARRRVVFVPDHPWLPINRTGREFILGVGRVYDIDDEKLMRHTDRLLDLFDLREEGDWPIQNYSNGQKHKISLCAALACQTPVLLLDEAFSGGLDPAGILALKRILLHLTREKGATAVISTPVPELIEEVADRIIVLRDGRVIAFDDLDGLRKQTECNGSLSEVLQRLIHPQILDQLERYFEEDA